MFKDAKVGDRVWSFIYGWGKIIDVQSLEECVWPFHAKFGKSVYVYFDVNGRTDDSNNPTIFWNKIKFKVPENKLVFPWENDSLNKNVMIGKVFKLDEVECARLEYVLDNIVMKRTSQSKFFRAVVLNEMEKLLAKHLKEFE